jgi:three-Cys-motif partner protein
MAVPEAYIGREQAYIKHKLLEKYLERFGYKIGSKWDTISYVDCFAGPWKSTDPEYRDTSFGLAVQVLTAVQKNLFESIARNFRLRFCLIEAEPKSFVRLQQYAEAHLRRGLEILPLEGQFEDHLSTVSRFVNESGPNAFRFLLLDPKGWTGFALRRVAPLVEARSAEILVNVMTYHIRRFVTQEEHAASFGELFGDERIGVEAAGFAGMDRERFLVRKYAEGLKKLAGFSYTSTAAVLRSAEDTVHYYLVFGTNSPHGIQVFKEAERVAFETGESARDEAKTRKRVERTQQSELDVFGEGLRPPSPFGLELRATHQREARQQLEALLKSRATIPYDTVLGTILETPLVWESDLLTWIGELAAQNRITITPPLGRKRLRIDGGFSLKST